jgi:Tfp pilus assembly protein PilZ
MRDVGVGGLFVLTGDPPPIGSFVFITATLPTTSQSIRLRGIVRWRTEGAGRLQPGCGIQWLKLSQPVLEALARLSGRGATSAPGAR